jgi:hypothetical protein
VEDIFAAIENDPEPSATKYLVRASYLQIYNEARACVCVGGGGGGRHVLCVCVSCWRPAGRVSAAVVRADASAAQARAQCARAPQPMRSTARARASCAGHQRPAEAGQGQPDDPRGPAARRVCGRPERVGRALARRGVRPHDARRAAGVCVCVCVCARAGWRGGARLAQRTRRGHCVVRHRVTHGRSQLRPLQPLL